MNDEITIGKQIFRFVREDEKKFRPAFKSIPAWKLLLRKVLSFVILPAGFLFAVALSYYSISGIVTLKMKP